MHKIPGKRRDCTCGKCGGYIDENRHCWCDGNRDPIAAIERLFPTIVCDESDGSMWREEVDILRVLYEASRRGEESPLVEDRGYMNEMDTYGVSWYWTNDGIKYPRQWDGPVVRLWSRLMIRPVRCGGGYTWIVLSDAAVAAINEALGVERDTAESGEVDR